jgi:hypothetical protein
METLGASLSAVRHGTPRAARRLQDLLGCLPGSGQPPPVHPRAAGPPGAARRGWRVSGGVGAVLGPHPSDGAARAGTPPRRAAGPSPAGRWPMSHIIHLDDHRPHPELPGWTAAEWADARRLLDAPGVDWNAETQGPLTLAPGETPGPRAQPRDHDDPRVIDLCLARAHRRAAAVVERGGGHAADAAPAGRGGPGRVGAEPAARPETDTPAGPPVEETTR